MGRFRVWIAVDIKDGHYADVRDAEAKCLSFFDKFSAKYLNERKFDNSSIGYYSVRESPDALAWGGSQKASNDFQGNIYFEYGGPYIEKSYFDSGIKTLERMIVAYNLLSNL